MERHFTIRYPDDYGKMWMNKDNLMLCINNYCYGNSGAISVSDITDGINELQQRLAAADQKLGWANATIEALQHTVEGLGQERDRLNAENERMRKGIAAVDELICQSQGVYGLHLNGDPAPWSELQTGGFLEDWLKDFDEAKQALEVPSGKD